MTRNKDNKPVIMEVNNRRYVTAYDGRRYKLVPRQDGCTGCCFFLGAGRCSRPEHGLQDVSCVDGQCCIIFKHADEEPQMNDASPKDMPKLTAKEEAHACLGVVTAYDGKSYMMLQAKDGCKGCCFFGGPGHCSKSEHGLQNVSCDGVLGSTILEPVPDSTASQSPSPRKMPRLNDDDEYALTWIASRGFQLDTIAATNRVRFRKRLFETDNGISMELVLYRDDPNAKTDDWQACIEVWSSGRNVLNKEWGHSIANVEDLALMLDSLSEDFREAARC